MRKRDQLRDIAMEEDGDNISDSPTRSGPMSDVVMIGWSLLPLVAAVVLLQALPLVVEEGAGGAVIKNALKKAFRGGIPGFFAAVVQILALMWLRTTMNYQFKTGMSFTAALRSLWAEGGISRFYKGWAPSIALVPLSRFGDSAANAGVLAIAETTTAVPVAFQTAIAAAAAASWRVLLMPLNVLKTNMQANGAAALPSLRTKVKREGLYSVFFRGTLAVMIATWMGYYPWFVTRNELEVRLPQVEGLAWKLSRDALIGCLASIVSDVSSNSIRVVSAYRQVADTDLTYAETIQALLKEGGINALFFRGLDSKVLANCLNSVIFNVMYRLWT